MNNLNNMKKGIDGDSKKAVGIVPFKVPQQVSHSCELVENRLQHLTKRFIELESKFLDLEAAVYGDKDEDLEDSFDGDYVLKDTWKK